MTLQKVAVPVPGPKPKGDAGEMKAMAVLCRNAGKKLVEGCGNAEQAVDGMSYQSPKATAIRATIGRHSRSGTQLAHALESFAKNLDTGAAALQLELKLWQAKVEAAEHANAWNRLVDAQPDTPADPNPLGVPKLGSI